MGGCRFKYEDLPRHLQVQVDGVLRKEAPTATDEAAAPAERRRRREPNKTEAAYRAEVLARRPDVAAIRYEGLTFRMENGHRYTPDWVVVTETGRIECHEVKGRYALHSQQRAKLAFDQARVEFPWFTWIWATRAKHGWAHSGGQCAGGSRLHGVTACQGGQLENGREKAQKAEEGSER